MIWLESDHLPTINSTILFDGAKPHGKGFSFTEPLNGSGDNSSARAKPTTSQGGWLKIQQDAEKAPRSTYNAAFVTNSSECAQVHHWDRDRMQWEHDPEGAAAISR